MTRRRPISGPGPRPARFAWLVALGALALAACTGTPAARAADPPPAPPPLARAKTDRPHVSVALLDVTRVSEGTIDVRFSLTNAADAPGPSAIAELVATAPDDRGSVADVSLVETHAAKKYFVVRDADHKPVSSRDLAPLAPGESRVLWARLAAPPPGAGTIGVQIPHAPLFANVPIAASEAARTGAAGKEPSRQAGRM
jgi:hypothetical protein